MLARDCSDCRVVAENGAVRQEPQHAAEIFSNMASGLIVPYVHGRISGLTKVRRPMSRTSASGPHARLLSTFLDQVALERSTEIWKQRRAGCARPIDCSLRHCI